ncbi:PucR family transcriptional regulator [Nonomuraea sp. NPDC059194]|uniref:PucR family transcriptional regulator n=1 Tax=Nonomuraea sp. NPDC059194 TaxID=3346764 RepID=UPI0036AF1743
MQAWLDALAAAIERSVSVDDLDGRLIAYSSRHADADPVRVAAILSRQVAPEIRRWQDRHGIATAAGPVRVPANEALGMGARVCVPIRDSGLRDAGLRDAGLRDSGRTLGYLWLLDPGQTLDDRALALAEETAREIAAAWHEDPDAMVRRLLTTGEGWNRTAPRLIQVCVVLPGSGRPERNAIGGFVTDSHAAYLLRQPADGMPEEEGVTRGYSDTMGPESAPEAYRQALTAAYLAAADPALPRHVSWAGLGPYRMLLGVADDPLAALDGEQAHTLETYLDLGGNAQRTASALHLHRTSLYYRLGRIADALGADLDDGMTRLRLHMALKKRRLDAGFPE